MQMDITGQRVMYMGCLLYTSNPVTDGRLTLSLCEPGQVQIFTVQGGRLFTQKLGSGLQTVDISRMPKGLYLIKAGDVQEKFIIE